MAIYEVEMQHTEKSFEALAHMQYDLFCGKNRIVRSLLSVGLILFGVTRTSAWWGILVVAYGCYLMTSTYSSANHTAHKLAAGLREAGLPFPASRYVFHKKAVEIISLPEGKRESELAYGDIFRLGEDQRYFYLFRDQYGGYVIPKEALGERVDAFRDFVQQASGQLFRVRAAPVIRLIRRVSAGRAARRPKGR